MKMKPSPRQIEELELASCAAKGHLSIMCPPKTVEAMERRGWVESDPLRSSYFYRITEAGRKVLAANPRIINEEARVWWNALQPEEHTGVMRETYGSNAVKDFIGGAGGFRQRMIEGCYLEVKIRVMGARNASTG